MKKVRYLLIIIVVVVIAVIFITSNDNSEEQELPRDRLIFDQIGYHKSDNNLRYFTFYVYRADMGKIDTDSEEFFNKLKQHGSSQPHTEGRVTTSFYYLDKNKTPDITQLNSQAANDLAHERDPIAAVWIQVDGEVNLIKNPE